MLSVLVDTGIWISLCDARDTVATQEQIQEVYSRIEPHQLVVPWPIAYETLKTRFVRNKLALELFKRQIKSPRVIFLDDTPYREAALELSFDSSLRSSRPLSATDCVIRLILDDENTRINYLATFNVGDFADVCAKKKIEIWTKVV